MTATAADTTELPDEAATPFRQRLIDGLAVSIRERGYRETTIADVVRHARTSRRTFYAEFASKDECYVALLYTTNEKMRRRIEAAVDAKAPWQRQVSQAVEAYIGAVASDPAIMLSWIRELPALGTVARTVQREAIDAMTELLLRLSDTEEFRRSGAGPLSRPLALLLLGGIRELTATTVEDGGDVRDLTEVATQAATALLAPRN
ncbi:TetR/AcrR family transcriptional regulator [Actinospica sp.]|jgi:AcrR family transcriptional regulator|uniref:TetR/AcrR family transcriptional regulator n=1 Tax=Actinospica sp. TaxID=1872142 RepID=UPI002CA2CCE1|nr:TetR family transcriptional regulator [Actinospica sp.]HWG28351.1 TetR family transcriptional regulator [Actinospica sp.]